MSNQFYFVRFFQSPNCSLYLKDLNFPLVIDRVLADQDNIYQNISDYRVWVLTDPFYFSLNIAGLEASQLLSIVSHPNVTGALCIGIDSQHSG